ncbi:hypothetical protein IL306_015044 [Fusarium sp. DS 682]|nr:hypothetical protein IL306_015044 [Fusarium sp. DS 682]
MTTRKRPRDIEEYDRYQGLVIYIGNVHYDAKPLDFEQFLHTRGISCKVLWPESFGRFHGGWCWARFELHVHANHAINNLHGAFFQGRKLEAGLVALNAKRVRFQDAPSSVYDNTGIYGSQSPTRNSISFSNEFKGFNPHTFFQSYDVPTYPATSFASTTKQHHRPAEYPDFYPVSRDFAPPTESFRQKNYNVASYPDCYPPKRSENVYIRNIPKLQDVWRPDKPFLDTAAIFAKGIKISGLAIMVNPEQVPPDGAVALSRPGK